MTDNSFSWARFRAEMEMPLLASYLDMIEGLLRQRGDSIEERYNEAIAQAKSANDIDEIELGFGSSFEETRETRELFYLNFIVLWYSFIEKTFLSACRELKIPTRKDDDNKEEIEICIKGLEKRGCQIKTLPHWKEMYNNIRKLRNRIVHCPENRVPVRFSDPQEEEWVAVNLSNGDRVFVGKDINEIFKYLLEHKIIDIPSKDKVWAEIQESLRLFASGTDEVEDKEKILAKRTYVYPMTPGVEYCKHLLEIGEKILSAFFDDIQGK